MAENQSAHHRKRRAMAKQKGDKGGSRGKAIEIVKAMKVNEVRSKPSSQTNWVGKLLGMYG